MLPQLLCPVHLTITLLSLIALIKCVCVSFLFLRFLEYGVDCVEDATDESLVTNQVLKEVLCLDPSEIKTFRG